VPTRQYPTVVRRLASLSWTVFVLFAVLAFLFGVFPGTWFDEGGSIGRDEQWLVTSYGAVAVVLTLAVAPTAFRRGERWAWWAFWVWPAFFVVHGIVFFPLDFVFAALGIAALLVARAVPGDRADAPPAAAE
jgi:hypothetical protein